MTRWAVGLGAVGAAALLIYMYMDYHVSEREAQCGQRCAAKGAKAYVYTPPARRRADNCECIR
jgi:hypothetical protein